MFIEFGDRIDWLSPTFPRYGTVSEIKGGIVTVGWNDGRVTHIPTSALQRLTTPRRGEFSARRSVKTVQFYLARRLSAAFRA